MSFYAMDLVLTKVWQMDKLTIKSCQVVFLFSQFIPSSNQACQFTIRKGP